MIDIMCIITTRVVAALIDDMIPVGSLFLHSFSFVDKYFEVLVFASDIYCTCFIWHLYSSLVNVDRYRQTGIALVQTLASTFVSILKHFKILLTSLYRPKSISHYCILTHIKTCLPKYRLQLFQQTT